MHQVVNRIEILRPRRLAKARTRRRDYFTVPAEEFEEARSRIHGLEAVQQQHRPACAASRNLELDTAHLQMSNGHNTCCSRAKFLGELINNVRRLLFC